MKTWAEFWADQVSTGQIACCQITDDDVVMQEAEQFDCSTCQLRELSDALDDDNREAWGLYRACCNRFVVDLQAGAVLLDRLTQDLDAEAFADQCERLRVLYDTLQPRKAP